MCGIVGYAGREQAADIIIEGLKKLEYRGYDSAGIAILTSECIEIKKKVGKIDNLEMYLKGKAPCGTCGIGHTRWATHGAPSDENAHPHTDENGTVAVVHNGIIENYIALREELTEKYGVRFRSETDTEVIAQMIGIKYRENGGNLEGAVTQSLRRMRGAYAIAVIANGTPDKIVAYRKDAPLIAGIGRGCNYVASDIPALLKYTNDILLIENDEMVVITPECISISGKKGRIVSREPMKIGWSIEDAEKGGYEHFMLKEISEQPKAVRETLMRRLGSDGKIALDGISITKEEIEKYDRICIVACGTAYHAGLVGKYIIEKLARIPVEVDVASEFRYRDPVVDERTLFIAVSQSGETLDTLAALREAKKKGARVLSVVNVVGSSVARESDDVFYTWAGPEIAVASTKGYTTQLVCMYLIALYLADLRDSITPEYYRHMIEELRRMPDRIEETLKIAPDVKELARHLYNRSQVFYIGRGIDSASAYEGSLKLKEISYINSFAISAGELKHGTIALMEPETTVIALATQDALFEKMYSNIVEINARLAHVISIAKKGRAEVEAASAEVFYIPECDDELTPLLSAVPLQLFAYYVAREKGEDIDKPRNLAKSVTVE